MEKGWWSIWRECTYNNQSQHIWEDGVVFKTYTALVVYCPSKNVFLLCPNIDIIVKNKVDANEK